MFDRVWEDTVKRVRALGVQELSVNKYVRDTQTFSKQIISFLKSREKCNLYGKNGFFKAMNSHNKEKAGNSFRDIIERLSANNI